MHSKRIRLLISFVVLFSLGGFSQSDQSAHPLLDKYYPQPKKDTAKNTVKENIQPAAPKPDVFPAAPIAKQAPPVSPPVVQPAVAREINTPAVSALPTPTSITTISTGNATPMSTATTLEKPPVVISADTVAVVKPAPVNIVKTPVKEAVQPRAPAPPPYMDTRLGSSTKQYDTYEKNSNGAGSVTTSPK
ncbi:MAG: hypothetical protein M3139_15980 [Bacteroidota bacterium]|nr:hypothetical protein [Bacteroidota bacterium]